MRILYTVPSLHADYGGPARSVPALALALTSTGEAEVVIRAMDGSQSVDERIRGITQNIPLSKLLAHGGRFELIHDHGLWQVCHLQVSWFASRLGIPRIVSPRGMLEPWALRHKGWKKRIAWRLYQRRQLNLCRLLHATSAEEGENLRNLGLTAPVQVIPNGTDLPVLTRTHQAIPFSPHGSNVVLFLSRIHPKKGLELLLNAWAACRPPGWRVRIAGPGDPSYIRQLKVLCQGLGIDDEVEWVGAAADSEKDLLYRSADLFVLPSYSENFGLVIAEALSYGIPVVTTTGCPWAELRSERAGWWVSPDHESILRGIREATSTDPEARREMGRKGRALIARKYGWESVARQMLTAYRRALCPV